MHINRLYAILLTAAIILIATGLFSPNITGMFVASWSDQTQSADSADAGTVVTFSALLKDADGLKNASLNVSLGGWAINGTQQLSGTQAVATFRYTIPNADPGTQVIWNIVFYDSTNSRSMTGTKSVTISDSVAPNIFDQKQAPSEATFGGAVLLSIRVSDNYKLAYVAFESNETGAFNEVRRYNITESEAIVSMSWSNASIKNETVIAWRAVANDSWGNAKTSETLMFQLRGCPACPAASGWSDCALKSGKPQQTQIYYDCNENTEFECALRTKTQSCIMGTTKAEAQGAIDNALQLITLAKSEGKDTTAAENLAAQATDALDDGNWELAKTKALDATRAAESATAAEEPAYNYLPILAGVILIVAVFWILIRFGKIPNLDAKRFKALLGRDAKTKKEKTDKRCPICGKEYDVLYKCEECGRHICFNDARTLEGKVYCTDDLKRKGLM